MSSLGFGGCWVYAERRASSSVYSRGQLVLTKQNLLDELDRYGVSSSSQRIHSENEQLPPNQKTNVTTGYSDFIFEKLCKVWEDYPYFMSTEKVNLHAFEQFAKASLGRTGS